MAKTAFFIVATRGRVGTILQEGLLALFRESGWRVVIFSPFYREEAFRHEFGGPDVFFEPLPPLGRWARRVAYVRDVAMRENHASLRASRKIHARMTRRFRQRARGLAFKKILITILAFLVPPPWKRSHAFWEFLMRVALTPSPVEKYMHAYRPHIIMVASGGAEGNDMPFIVFGKKYNVATCAIDSNTDAATFRYFSAPWRVSHWALFSDIQKTEFHELHGISEECMTVVGALRYDHYFRGFAPRPRAEFLRKIGVDEKKTLITLGAKTPIVYPHNEDVITLIQKAIKAGRFGDAVLYVRFDPGHDLSVYSKEFLDSFLWERAEKAPDGEHIANLLAHSAVYVGLGATTLSIEACAVGTPSLWIGFDGNVEYQDRNDSCRLQYDLPVFKRIVESGSIPLVESKEEMLAVIGRFIAHKDANKKEREVMLAREYANAHDGRAAERIFALVRRLSR